MCEVTVVNRKTLTLKTIDTKLMIWLLWLTVAAECLHMTAMTGLPKMAAIHRLTD